MINLLYATFLGFWRRWFGGLFDESKYAKILNNRFLQHVVGFAACFSLFFFQGTHWLQSIIIASILQGLYWARSHGCCFDYGHGQPPDIKRYEQLWYWKYVKKIIPESEWYTFTGDYILMTVRYTIPSILLAIASWSYPVLFAGIVLSSVYALMWKLYDWKYTTHPTAIAEVISGFTTGLLLACCV